MSTKRGFQASYKFYWSAESAADAVTGLTHTRCVVAKVNEIGVTMC